MSHKKTWGKTVRIVKRLPRCASNDTILAADRIVRAAIKMHSNCQRDPDFAPECSACINRSLCRAVENFEREGKG